MLWADARAVAGLLAPGTAVDEAGGALAVGGEPTQVPARRHGGALYAPVRDLARLFGAYVHVTDDGGTIWPRERLCEYRPGASAGAAVFRGAEAEGLFAGCPGGPARQP